mgnify:CR=1 FL=1
MLRKISMTVMCAALVTLCSSCGYHIGFIKHPQIDSLAVAPVINQTTSYNAASDMRMMMSEGIMQDGTYKLSDQKRADAILYLTVTQIGFNEFDDASVERNNQYKPSEWRTTVAIGYKLLIPGQGQPIRSGTVKGTAQFQANVDLESVRLRSARQACYEAAKKIIYQISEGW